MSRIHSLALAITSLAIPAISACGDASAAGPQTTVSARIYGEDFVELGIPASMFGDGWSMKFERFLVSIGDVSVASGEDRSGTMGYRLVDLAKPSRGVGTELATFGAPAGNFDSFSYTIAPAPLAGPAIPTGVEPALAAEMAARGHSVWITGTAIRGGERVRVDLGFDVRIAHDCAVAAQGNEGGRVELQATFHGDHVLFDAARPEPYVRFQLLADSDGADGSRRDGTITRGELAAKDVRGEPSYRIPGVATMAQYLEHQLAAVGHVNGEGACARRTL